MMRRFYALLSLVVALLMSIGAWADSLQIGNTFTADGILYQVSNNNPNEVSVGVTWWIDGKYHEELVDVKAIKTDTVGVVDIPSSVIGTDGQSYSVTSIQYRAFRGCSGITDVSIGDNIRTIDEGAFMECEQLKSVSIPASVISIDKQAFAFTHLETISIPNSITKLAESIFAHDIYLTSVYIPSSVTSIGENAFYNCHSLPSIVIPGSVKAIGAEAFHDCDGLTVVTSLIEEPFSLVSEKFGFPVKVFGTKSYNATLYVPAGTKAKYEATEGWKEFKNIVEMESENKDLKVGDTFTTDGITYQVTSIDPMEVQVGIYHTSDTIITAVPQDTIGAIVIPSSVTAKDGNLYYVTSIGYQAFRGCINITSLSMPETITEIEPQSFVMCVNLSSINISSSVKTIGYNAFMNCSKLQSVSLPNSITSIGFGAFGWCPNLLEVYSYIENPFAINNGGMGDAYNPFDFYREGLTLYIPVGTKALYEATDGWKEFKNIVEMKSENKGLKVGDTFTSDGITYQVTSIDPMEVQVGDGKHSVIDDVTPMDVDIPSTVTGPDSNVYTVTSIAKLAFFDCNEVTSIKLPSTIVSIGDQSFQACRKVPSITIPKSVTYIGFRAFAECSKLTEIYSQIEEPFALADEAFRYKYINAETYYNRVTLYVPAGTKAKYEATEGWKDFKNIVEMVELDPIDGETTVSTENLSSEDLTDNVVNDVYYNVGSEGYDASDKSVVISQTTNMGQITDATPGSSEVKNNFNGLILKVAAGKGTITVNVKTTGNAQLVVQVGNQTPMIASKTEQGDVVVSYDVAEDTYVYIYAIIGSSAAPAHRAAPADAVKIYSIKVTPGATGIDTVHSAQSTVHSCYTLDGRKLEGQPTKKGVYIINGKKIVIR